MRVPVLQGVIERRILANCQVDPDVLAKVLPSPFRPKLVNGVGVAGICLIRLRHIRPVFVAGRFGLSSENAAHRIAVEWTDDGVVREGVYVPRRDTSSTLNTLFGGKLFPGIYHHAKFEVEEEDDRYRIALESNDGFAHVIVEGRVRPQLPPTSAFSSLQEASAFFEAGSMGYSPGHRPGEFDRMELRSLNWKVEPLAIERFESSFFEDHSLFPSGSLRLDCGLLMRGIQHEWHGQRPLCHAVGEA